jgi:hypothetical protein
VVSKNQTNGIIRRLSSLKETPYWIGEITSGSGEVRLHY